jgi:hypothetical protein
MPPRQRPVPSPASTGLEQRKRFRKLDEARSTHASRGALGDQHRVLTADAADSCAAQQEGVVELVELVELAQESSSGLFELLDDETLVQIMHLLVEIPQAACTGLALRDAVMNGARHLRSLLLTCSRMHNTLLHTGRDLHTELAARGATQIEPQRVLELGPYPFTHQMRLESKSSDQLRVLREGIACMATHCASKCCAKARNDFNRTNKDCRILVASARSTVLAPSPCGSVAFVSARRREAPVKQRLHNRETTTEGGHAGASQSGGTYWITRVERTAHAQVVETESLRLDDLHKLSAPQTMRCCDTTRSVAMVRAVHSANADERIPHSVVMLWHTSQSADSSLPTHRLSQSLDPPTTAEDMGAINAQDAWWVRSGPAQQRLAVLWSTAYVHPMGTVVGANADNACYFIALYNTTDSDAELEVLTGPFEGKAQTASPSARGDHVAVLVRKAPIGNGPRSIATRATVVHDVCSDNEPTRLEHSSALTSGRANSALSLPPHPFDLEHCPSAVGLSPGGDCVIAVHRRYLTVLVEVLVRTAPGVFVSVQTIDVTHWTSIGRSEPSLFDHQGATPVANALRLPYRIVFSPCGRFAAVTDQRPLFGLAITNHALVVLDMCHRLERRGVRALPLAPWENVAPRSIDWAGGGIWLQARFGALALCAC